jgi:putative transposase
MANVFSQISIQLVFAVKNRDALIKHDFSESLHKYIGGILVNQKHNPLAINSSFDHIHIFFGMHHTCVIPDLVRDIKSDTSLFINSKKLSPFYFQWQEGYAVFSYSMSHRGNVINYIENQKEHHRKESFRQEYLKFLKKFEIEYNEKYSFDFFF